MRSKFLIFSVCFTFYFSLTNAQNIDFAREVINKLVSENMYGRGYVNNGDKIAADFIRYKFDSLGLEHWGEDYFQPFNVSVNTLPGKISLSVDGKLLTTGADYHVDPGSPSVSGKFKVLYLSPNELLNRNVLVGRLRKSKGRFIVLESYDKSLYSKEQNAAIQETRQLLTFANDIETAGIIELVDQKLTWFAAPIQYPRPYIRVSSSALDQAMDEVEVNIEAELKQSYQTNNVVGYIPGEKSDSLIVITAHYDHLGMMGDQTRFPGANDNASGVALMLDMARNYASIPPPNTIVFIAFSGEELGLQGSQYFVENPLFNLARIKFLLNFDIAGTGDDGIQIVNGSVFTKQFDLITQVNADHNLLPQVRVRGEACNSDHCLFYRKGVPSFFIYTLGGIQAYHDIYDKGETLPLTNYEPYFELLLRFIDKL